MSRAFGKRLAALVLAPVLVLTTFVIVVPAVLTVTAPPSVAAEASNAAPFTGPIGSENDPWPQSFPRDSNVVHKSNLEKTRIALVFDFDARYTWESMGGNVIPGGVNFDQSKQIKKSLQNLEGAPVRVGIYTFDQFDRSAGNYPDRAWGNTPDLPATSLENKEGFDKVMAKLDSLDATGGTGRRKGSNHSDDFSNQEQGLQKVINDMDKYHYTDVFLFTTGMPNRCGEHDQGCTFDWSKLRPDQQEYLKQSGAWDGSNNGVHDWDKYTYSRMGIIAAALKAQELQAKGAKLRIMQMYTYSGSGNECPTKREQYALNYAGYMLGDKITYQCGDQKVPGGQSTTHDRITVTVPENIKDQWINIRHAGHFNTWYSDQPKNSDGSPDGDLIKKM